MYNFLPHTDKVRKDMLQDMGLNSVEDLFKNINPQVRVKESLDIPEGISELEAQRKLISLSEKNLSTKNCISFLGGGTYNRYIPACINTVIERSEFITAYTPYQPEVSQGTLQAMYEYQSMICNLTGMDVANASVYDGASAAAEAILMAARLTNKSKALVASTLNPEYKQVIETYCSGESIQIEYIPFKDGKSDINSINQQADIYACILIQNPNYLGSVEDVYEISGICKNIKAKFIVSVDPVSLALLKSPGQYGADIVVGDIQPLGIGMSYGGPHAGFIACKTEYLRQIPGRIAGMTKDRDGETAFTLTMQTREQHIRRAKATSNICSNQALMALAATTYLSVMGPEGLKEAANISTQRAHYLAGKINEIPGFKVLYSNFLYEFVVQVQGLNLNELTSELKKQNILPGINLGDKFNELQNCLLICVTEMNDVDSIDKFVESLTISQAVSCKKY